MSTNKKMKKWRSIEKLDKCSLPHGKIIITEKIDGTNAHILIGPDDTFKTFSRTREITPEDDNYGFAKWAYSRKETLIQVFSKEGEEVRIYGEWYGPGIAPKCAYNITEPRFALFSAPLDRAGDFSILHRVDIVPTLYTGEYSKDIVDKVMQTLQEHGSYISKGFMRPEGIVIHFLEQDERYKRTFVQESKPLAPVEKVKKEVKEAPDVSMYIQPIRLEKLLSRDERYLKEYPSSIARIVDDYIKDLVKEGELIDTISSDTILPTLRQSMFKYVKQTLTTGQS